MPVASAHGLGETPLSLAEAAFILWDTTQARSFETYVRPWAALLEVWGTSVRVAVGTKTDSLPLEGAGAEGGPDTATHGASEGERRGWCLDAGVEYMATSLTDPASAGALPGDREKEGVYRLEEALHTHMWPDMELAGGGGDSAGGGGPVGSLLPPRAAAAVATGPSLGGFDPDALVRELLGVGAKLGLGWGLSFLSSRLLWPT